MILIGSIISAAKFNIGDTVEVYNTGSSGLIVRGPNACDAQIGGKFDGSRGVVLTGPVFCNSYNRWKIRWNDDGLEGWSAEDWLREVSSLPSAPTLVSPTDGSTIPATTPTLDWSDVSANPAVDYYNVQIRQGSTKIHDAWPTTSQYTVPSGVLSSGVTYNWYVFAHNSLGFGPVSSIWYFTVNVNQLPTCSLSANPTSGKAPLTVTFSMSASDSDGYISVWGLDVNGDGNPDYSGYGNLPPTQTHTYTTLGSYSVVLAVLDNDGASCVDTVTIVVGENKPPTASLSPDKSSGKAPLTVTFSMSANDPDGWISSWELAPGDGNSYSGIGNPPSTKTHTYTSQGSYTAIFGVTDNDGTTTFDTKPINIAPPNQLPDVSLTANPTSGKAPLTVTFTMSASDFDGSISAWVLDVNGDGNADYSGYGNPPSVLSHTYTTSGSYTAMLVVSDNDGATDFDVETINVGSPNQPPECFLSASPKSGNAPLEVTFTMSAGDSDGSITTWLLNTGDGNSYSGSGNPPSTQKHTYINASSYNAVLGVSDNDDATDFAGEIINVGPPIQLPSVLTSEASNIDLISATLNGNLVSTGGETCEVWFEYGLTTSYGYSTSKQSKSSTDLFSAQISGLQSSKTYHFRACASNSKGTVCGSDLNFTTLLSHPPNPPTNLAQFKSDLLTEIPIGSVIDEQLVFFKADVSDPDGDKVKLQVELRQVDDNFLDRLTQQSSLVSNQVSVAAYGLVNDNYHWQARVVDEHGLVSGWVEFGDNPTMATDFSVRINDPPFATFVYSPKEPEIGQEIFFDAFSSYDPDGGQISYEWDFGDNNNAQGIQAIHSYSAIGYYTVILTIVDDEGTKDSYSLSFHVFSKAIENTINENAEKTKIFLDNILNNAGNVANVANDFQRYVEDDKWESVWRLAVDFFGGMFSVFKIMDVKKISALSIGDNLRLAEKYPSLADVLNDHGWVIAKSLKDINLDYGMEIVKEEMFDRLRSNNYDYYNTFYPDLYKKNRDRKNNLTALKNEVINNLGSLTQEEINLYQKDLRKRQSGNTFIDTLYSIKVLMPTTFKDIKFEEETSWYAISAKVFYEIGLFSGKLALSAIGIPWYLPWGISALSGTLSNVEKLDTDSQMLVLSTETLFDGFTQSDIISRSTYQGIENIKNKTEPQIPEGKIVSIENLARGFGKTEPIHYNKRFSFLYKDIYSIIKVNNTGNVKARFELATVYYKKFSTSFLSLFPKLTSYQLPVVIIDSKEIEPGQTETFEVWYKKNDEGVDPKNQVISFSFLAQTDNGIYGIATAVTKFETTKILLNDVNISEEELKNATMYPYPLSSELENSSDTNYSLNIYLENPFDFSVQVNLTQEIPSYLDILSAANGTIDGRSISWELALGPEEKERVTITLKLKEMLSKIEIAGAILKIYDQVNDYWVEFQSNDINISFYNLNISLNKGWNLISIPINLMNNSIDYLFNNTNFTIYSYKNNSWFIPDKIDNKLGYWFKINESINITLVGTEIKNKTIQLNGQNLIGYPHLEEKIISSLFNNVTVFAYNNSKWYSYNSNKPSKLNNLTKFTPGYGYWVKTE